MTLHSGHMTCMLHAHDTVDAHCMKPPLNPLDSVPQVGQDTILILLERAQHTCKSFVLISLNQHF